MDFSSCPRCGDQSFEYLESLGHCVSCFYSTDDGILYDQIPKDALRDMEDTDEVESSISEVA